MPRSAAPASPKRRRSAFPIPNGTSGRCCWSSATTAATSCEAEIRDYPRRRRSPNGGCPTRSSSSTSLPHTATGKLSKKDLRDQYRDYRFANAEAMVGPRLEKARARRLTGARNFPQLTRRNPRPHGRPICICHEGHDQVLPRRPEAGAQPHQPAILSRRQDRHRRPQRRRQVDADEDHGRHRQGIHGEAWPGEKITVGYLPQEPQLDPTKTVLENVKDGARPVADMVDRFNAISAQMGDPPRTTDFDALMAEMGELQGKIDAVDGWTLDNQLEIAMDALRCPPGDASVENLSGGEKRRVALTRLLLEKPEHPAARRADQPPRRRKRPVARKASRWTIRAT